MVSLNKLVSVIIPCFNAEKWLREAIDSALSQTYPNLEVIVIDDGSTDGSLDIIKSYGSKIIWETGPNIGGNHARNLGFLRSSGDYIQFLDADDYLLPGKIQRQVEQLEQSKADVIYGDWQYQYHQPNGDAVLDAPKISGSQGDILASLLAGWWVSPACLLFSRQAVIDSGGWDETLTAGQDRDFFTSVAMTDAKVIYQPGCYSIYRRHGNSTVSTKSKSKFIQSYLHILEKNKIALERDKKLTQKYKNALAQTYFSLARKQLPENIKEYKSILEKAIELNPDFCVETQEVTTVYRLLQNILGFRKIEALVVLAKQARSALLSLLPISIASKS